MIELIKNEWRALIRRKLLLFLGLFFMIVMGLTCWVGLMKTHKISDMHAEAKEHIRAQWDAREASNPHSAAHYGTYVFKPHGLLSSIDEGVQAVTGNVLRLEGHVQNEMEFSEASQSLVVSAFGKLSSALLLQYVVPLMLIFLAYSSVSSERESGRLKLLVIQGLPLSKMIFYKSIAILLVGALLLFSGLVLQVFVQEGVFSSDTALRLISVFAAYLSFYFILILLTVLLSAWLKNSTASLSVMLATWVVWVIFLPRIFSSFAEGQFELPSRASFKAAMQEDRQQGIDGHAPSGERQEQFKQRVLEQYGVDSVSQLPINIDGLRMQADEEYGNKVWDKHFGKNYEILADQKKLYQLSGLLDPFIALQNLSMGFSGTDLYHHQDFVFEAETYRRVFIKALNDEHAFGGSKSGDWQWKAEQEFFKNIADFDYQMPAFKRVLPFYWRDVLVILFWLVALSTVVLLVSKKISLI